MNKGDFTKTTLPIGWLLFILLAVETYNLSSKLPTKMHQLHQNRRQKVFNRGALHFCGGLDTQKINKAQLIYSVSCFNLGVLGASFGGLSPQKPPVATGLNCTTPLQERHFPAPLRHAENSSCIETEKSYLCKVLHFNRQNLLIGPPND